MHGGWEAPNTVHLGERALIRIAAHRPCIKGYNNKKCNKYLGNVPYLSQYVLCSCVTRACLKSILSQYVQMKLMFLM